MNYQKEDTLRDSMSNRLRDVDTQCILVATHAAAELTL